MRKLLRMPSPANTSRRLATISPILLAALLTLLIFFAYLMTSRSIGNGDPLMPVDDAYIHFQYARQIAAGQPYQYNLGLPPTSGATSLLYPYILAVGYSLGFTGLSLGIWAMLIGAMALFGALLAVYGQVRAISLPRWIGLLGMTVFALNGAVAWHFMSGMETGLMMCFVLWTLYAFIQRQPQLLIVTTTLLAITRPEGSMMAVIAALLFVAEGWRANRRLRTIHAAIIVIPIAASLLQPLLNLALTGSPSAAGNQAKSLLSMIPAYPDELLLRIGQNFLRLWRELLIGVGEHDILYVLPLLLIFAGVGLVWVARENKRPFLLVLILAWLLIVSLAISTLDTAFWHFKRYQMPLIALLFPLAGWAFGAIRHRLFKTLLITVMLGFSLVSASNFFTYYVQNVQSIKAQPLAMARWLMENTPPDAFIAVHDVGLMRYLGERTTIDLVGLTTPGAADAWRNGPGAVGEFLITVQPRPDYVAAYTEARGLGYLAQTDLYGELLAGFTADYDPRFNVALGGAFQGIFQPDWRAVDSASVLHQPTSLSYVARLQGSRLVDQVDVADLASEKAHRYRWSNAARPPGFATEFYQQGYIDCIGTNIPCIVMDGGRSITGEEAFTLNTTPGEDVLLITRVHPTASVTLEVYANDVHVATRLIPAQPGQWMEIPTLIRAASITDTTTRIRIMANMANGSYMPYIHWAYQGQYDDNTLPTPEFTFETEAITGLVTTQYDAVSQAFTARITWASDGTASGEYRVFLHIYPADAADQPPVAQVDRRTGGGALSTANWLPGTITDDFVVDLAQVPPGKYVIALGLYDPVSSERLLPVSAIYPVDEVNRRLFIQQITVDSTNGSIDP
jgi:hypothetical protein